MISLTLNSKKGTDKTTYPTVTYVGYFEVNGTQSTGTTVNIYAPSTVSVPQYIAKIGDYFMITTGTTPTKKYFITAVSNSSYTISTTLTDSIANFQIINIYSPNAPFYDSTSLIGYRIGSGVTQSQFFDTKFSLKSFSNFNNNVYNNSICKVINSDYLTLTDASTDSTINSFFISSVTDSNIFTMNKPFTASIGGATVITFFQKTYNNVNYQIDTTVFEDSKKYALSFSFSSSPCVLNYNAKQALVYVNLGSDKSYDNNSSYMTQSNFLGYLKNNIFYSNPSNVITSNSSNNVVTHNNVSFHTLCADPANVPLIINKPVSNNLTIQILNEDGTPFQDNSNIGLMPPYVITLYFKPID
jgi:hypothetical protein